MQSIGQEINGLCKVRRCDLQEWGACGKCSGQRKRQETPGNDNADQCSFVCCM